MIEVRSIDLFNGLIQSALDMRSQLGQSTWLMMWLVGMICMGKNELVEQTYDFSRWFNHDDSFRVKAVKARVIPLISTNRKPHL